MHRLRSDGACDQGHQQADPRCRAADADGDEPPRQGRSQEEAGPQGGQVESRRRPPGYDGQGEGTLRVQAPSPDRKAVGEPHRVGTRRPDPSRMLEYLPELATLRRFADRIYWLFDTPKGV